MKNYLILALIALGVNTQVAAYYDKDGNWHRDGLFGWRARSAERRGNYSGNDRSRGAAVRNANKNTSSRAYSDDASKNMSSGTHREHEGIWERHEDRVETRRERRARGERNPGVVGTASDITHGVLGDIGL